MQRVAVELRCYATTRKIANTKLAARVEDLSRSGVRFALDAETAAWQPFEKGDPTTVEVILPAEHDLGERCIYARGRVVRVSGNSGGPASVSVHFTRANFRELKGSRAPAGLKLISELRM